MYQQIVESAKATGRLERLFVWGSFATEKEVPNDLDILLVMRADFAIDKVPEASRPLFDHVEARFRYQADVFWTRSSMSQEMLEVWLDTYQWSKDKKSKRGILEVAQYD